jgi:hypothetical protein
MATATGLCEPAGAPDRGFNMTTTARGMIPPERSLSPVAFTPGRIWGWALAAAVVAGVVSGLGGERVHKRYDVPGEATTGQTQPQEVFDRIARAQVARHAKEGQVLFGLVGAAAGLSLGLAGGLARRNLPAALGAGVVGLVLAGAAGAAAGQLTAPFAYRDVELLANSATRSLLIRGAIYAAVGLASGLAFGIGLGGRGAILNAAVGGLLGALAATVVYEVAGSLMFPVARTYQPIATTAGARYFAELTAIVFIAAGTAVLASNGVKTRKRTA